MIFGVDFDREEVVLVSGARFIVDAWYDVQGEECEPLRACTCIFKSPAGVWYAVDLAAYHTPVTVH
jgi:hypothetical protein